jgi:LacI family transcriptional regulator
MPRHRARDIALQSGLSDATVERVLNNRGHVRTSTIDAVKDAIAKLDRQPAQTQRHGRRFTIEVIVITYVIDVDWHDAIRRACEATLQYHSPALTAESCGRHRHGSSPPTTSQTSLMTATSGVRNDPGRVDHTSERPRTSPAGSRVRPPSATTRR